MNDLTNSVLCDIIVREKGRDCVEAAGEIIRRMMEQKGIGATELGKRVGKAQNTVSTALKSKNMGFENFNEYVEALGYEIQFVDGEGEKLLPKKERIAPRTKIVIGHMKYDTYTAEPLVCAEQSDGLFAELYRKTTHEYFVVYFEKGRRGTINPVSENAARAFWRQYKSENDKDDLLD